MMKTILLWLTVLANVNAFGVVTNTVVSPIRLPSTALRVNIAEEDMTTAQREIVKIQQRWNRVRHLSAEEISASDEVEEDLKAAHTRFYERYHLDMTKMTEIADKLTTLLDPPKVAKKSNSQRKRDKWAIVQARMAARAAAKK